MIDKITGTVVKGKQIGRTIGFPTANFSEKNLLENDITLSGVFCVMVTLPNEIRKIGVCNIGLRPTVDSCQFRTMETHILDFEGDLYGKEITVEIYKRIRDIKKFNSLDELKCQMLKDISVAKKYFSEKPISVWQE